MATAEVDDARPRLAASSYGGTARVPISDGRLNLAWTTDEQALLSIDVADLVRTALETAGGDLEGRVFRYLVDDPFGEGEMRDSVARFFSLRGSDFGVTCGAGVNSLLHGLAGLAAGGTVYVIGEVYPDFPYWVSSFGGRCVAGAADDDVSSHVEKARAIGAAIVLLDRPSLTTEPLGQTFLSALCAGVSASDGWVLVDESYANYWPPSFSAAALVERLPNLAVLRGFSKAYSAGGIRLGFCLSSRALTDRLRSVLPAMLASTMALEIGRLLLAAGDVTTSLRDRIEASRASTIRLLAGAGIEVVRHQGRYLPHLLCLSGTAQVQTRLEAAGILTKVQPYWDAGFKDALRISVPLTTERVARLDELLASGATE